MIKISTEDFAETEDGLTTDLVFTFTTKYPDVGPKVEIENENVSEPESFEDLSLIRSDSSSKTAF